VWGIACDDYLFRIDQRTNRVTFREHIAGLSDMAAGAGAIWVVTTRGTTHGQLLKIDPASGQFVRAFPLQRWSFTNDEGVAKINPATGRIVRIYGYQSYDPTYSMGLDFFTCAQATSVLRVSMATGRPRGEVPGVGSCGEPCWQVYFAGGSVWVPTMTHITRIDPVSRPPRTGRR